jgi:16S rRNA (cytosine1402-N4)-methyltransferase
VAINFQHVPVMPAEVLAALQPKQRGVYADGTVGGGGHAEAILEASSPSGWLYGCDRDGDAVEAASARLSRFAGRFEIRQGNFAELSQWVPAGSCDGVLLDLGVSSAQVDQAERGFSFQNDGPLDMRMDRRQALTARELVNGADETELAEIFWKFGEERQSRRFAREIVRARAETAIETTGQLAGLIEKIAPRHGRKAHPATRVFQALRIAVNLELEFVREGLLSLMTLLKPGGRMAIITFQSLEDRMVKQFGRDQTREYTFPGEVDVPELRRPRTPPMKWVTRKAILPGEAELAANPRSRSAQLRVLEKTE